MSFGEQLPQEVASALLLDDDLQDEVKREMQEAIEKDMESINGAVAAAQQDMIHIEIEEEPMLIDTGIKIAEEEKKIEEDSSISEKVAPGGKEIQLSADQFKLI